MRITIILAILLSGLVLSASCNTAYAQYNDIGQSQIHPAHPLYFLKAIREILELKFAGTPRVKMVRQLEFATRRLREVKSLSQIEKDGDLIAANLERYWFHMNTVLGYRPREEWLTLLLNHTISTHLSVLESLYEKIESEQSSSTNKRARMSIRTAIFRVLNNSDIPAEERVKRCEFLSKEASSSGLTEVERAIWTERAEICYML